jgi:hypothetical protein
LVQDPWGWPEIGWLASRAGFGYLGGQLSAPGAFRALPLDVTKENFATRPACVLNPVDRLAYQSRLDFISIAVAAGLPDFVCGWRLPRDDPVRGVYASNAFEWSNYRRHLLEFARRYEFALTTDVVSFFSTINLGQLAEQVQRTTRRSRARDRLNSYLDAYRVHQVGRDFRSAHSLHHF